MQASTTANADGRSSVYSRNADGSYKTDDYTASGQLSDEVVVRSATSFTNTVYQSVNGTAAAEASYQFNADGSWVEDDLDDALAGSPLLVQQVHHADGTQTDYVHAPEGGQSYSSYTRAARSPRRTSRAPTAATPRTCMPAASWPRAPGTQPTAATRSPTSTPAPSPGRSRPTTTTRRGSTAAR